MQAAQRDGQERVHIGLLGGAFPALRPDMLAGPLEAPPRARRARLLCEWAAHPTSLLLAAGMFCSGLSTLVLARHTLPPCHPSNDSKDAATTPAFGL